MGAYLIDGVILWLVGKVIGFAFGGALAPVVSQAAAPGSEIDPQKFLSVFMPVIGALLFVNMAITLAYYVSFTTACGATPGKLALGMRILKTDGSKIGFGTALGRYVVQTVLAAITCGGLFYISILTNNENRGWHDQLLDTMVVDN